MLLRQCAVAHRQKIQQAERCQRVLHHGGAGDNAGVVPPLDLQLSVLLCRKIHGVLLFINAGGGLYHRAEHQRHPVGDAAVHAAVAVGGSAHRAVLHRKGVVGFAAAQPGKGKARAEFHALAGGDGKHQVGKLALDTVKPRLAHTGGQPGDDGFQNAAHAVALRPGVADRLLHSGFFFGIQQGKMPRLRLGQQQPRRAGKGCVLNPGTGGNVGVHPHAQIAQNSLADSTRRDRCRRDASRKMPAAACILIPLILGVCRVVGVTRAQQLLRFGVVAAAGILVADHQGQRRAGGSALIHAGQKLHLVRLGAGGRKPIAPGAAAIHRGCHGCLVNGQPCRQTVQHSADGGTVALAKNCHRYGISEGVFHTFIPSPAGWAVRSAAGFRRASSPAPGI